MKRKFSDAQTALQYLAPLWIRLISFHSPLCFLHRSYSVPFEFLLVSDLFTYWDFWLVVFSLLQPPPNKITFTLSQAGWSIHPLDIYLTAIPSEKPGLIFFCNAYHVNYLLNVCAFCLNSNSFPRLPKCKIHEGSNHTCFIHECVLHLWGPAHCLAYSMCPVNMYGKNEWMKVHPNFGILFTSTHLRAMWLIFSGFTQMTVGINSN